ncbi:MAG: dual specificity protein phosphatase family protein [Anaerolineales bacterium]|nr:dual specificity protein phosphatase family protein [Chloroflexota bacterium]MBL6981687.1 dual specificity protein phosphatase family protein [Anaerolineales bacterium]
MDFSKITDYLYVGKTPLRKGYEQLRELRIDLIINMRVEYPPPRNAPIQTLWLPSADHPFIWIPIRLLKRGVDAALEVIGEGGKVYTHCHGGVHRAVAMASCILIAQGHSPKEAMALVKAGRPKADPEIWYIRRQILAFSTKYSDQNVPSR